MSVEAIIVNQWNGLDVRPRHALPSKRRQLDTPRVLTNVQVDDYGHLHYPAASADLVHTFGDDVHTVSYIEEPRSLVVQLHDGRVYTLALGNGNTLPGGSTPVLRTTLTTPGFPLWVASAGDFSLIGYATRGAVAADGQVFKVTSGGTWTEITGAEPFDGHLSYSEFYKGRRFVVSRGRSVRFSELNQFETFEADSIFQPGGDDQGVDYTSFPGAVQGMASWEDVLLLFNENSVWMLSGSGPETWQLRQAMTNVGNSQPFAISRVDDGVLTYGGRNLADLGVYRFAGNTAEHLSSQIDPLLRTFAGLSLFGTQAYGQYVLCKPQASASALQVFLLDLRAGRWSTFDGWRHAATELTSVGLFVTDGPDLYLSLATNGVFPRRTGRTGKITLGWEDDGHTAGQSRFLGVKLAGTKTGSGTPTVTLKASVPGGVSVTSAAVPLTTDVFDNVVVPVQLRGHAIELELTITPTHDTDAVTLESLQVIASRKGEKLSRG